MTAEESTFEHMNIDKSIIKEICYEKAKCQMHLFHKEEISNPLKKKIKVLLHILNILSIYTCSILHHCSVLKSHFKFK